MVMSIDDSPIMDKGQIYLAAPSTTGLNSMISLIAFHLSANQAQGLRITNLDVTSYYSPRNQKLYWGYFPELFCSLDLKSVNPHCAQGCGDTKMNSLQFPAQRTCNLMGEMRHIHIKLQNNRRQDNRFHEMGYDLVSNVQTLSPEFE